MKIRNAILILACLVTVYASLLQAQEKQQLIAGVTPGAEVINVNTIAAPASSVTGEPPAAPNPVPSPPQGAGAIDRTSQDNMWHVSVSPYLWLPWIHGTVGALGDNAGFSVTPSDLLSHARFGLLGAVEARRNRLLTNVDLLYMRLGDDKALPALPPPLIATSANLTANILILTPKVGIRLI